MTKLEAVNLILRKAGLNQVADLDNGGPSDAAEAERCLDEEDVRIQMEGWHFNMREDVELEPNAGNSHIYLPDGCLTIDSDQEDAWRNITQIGNHLYDRDDNTDEFDDSLKCSYTLRYSFPCVPQEVATYIAVSAAIVFVENRPLTREKSFRLSRLDGDLRTARGLALQINGDREDINTLNTIDAIRMRGGRARVMMPVGLGVFVP